MGGDEFCLIARTESEAGDRLAHSASDAMSEHGDAVVEALCAALDEGETVRALAV